MKSIQKARLGLLISFIGMLISALSTLTYSVVMIYIYLLTGITLVWIGLIMMVYHGKRYNEEIAQKNTDKVEEFIKERTGVKIPPPPWMKEKKKFK